PNCIVRGPTDVENVRPKFGFSTDPFGLAKFVWLNALNISVRNSNRYRSLIGNSLKIPTSAVLVEFPLSRFWIALPNRGAWAGCFAVLSGQSNASRFHRGVFRPLPPSRKSPEIRSGRHWLNAEELQLPVAILALWR